MEANNLLNKPLLLKLKTKDYPWGRIGQDSLVAQLLGPGNYDEKTPYAELWIGAHPNGCAEIVWSEEPSHKAHKISLSQAIEKNPAEILGEGVVKRFGGQLPFLAKVLSVRKALSIQAHPDKLLAVKFHAQDPKHYPDKNHKPELAIALSTVRLLYGFRSSDEINSQLQNTPELKELVGNSAARDLKDLYKNIVLAAGEKLTEKTATLIERLKSGRILNDNERLVLELASTYSSDADAAKDIGLMTSLLMNCVTIPPGKAIYIATNTPHSYLSGNIFECTASSDNVVRAGLTDKFQDSAAFLEMVNFVSSTAELISPEAVSEDAEVLRYCCRAEEFVMDVFKEESAEMCCKNVGFKLFFCLTGQVRIGIKDYTLHLGAGQACVVPAQVAEYSLKLEEAKIFRIGI